jgi:serine/threonine protein kinase
MPAAAGEPNDLRGRAIGRYVLHDEIASGGVATVHLGRMTGPAGFSRTVAIKRLHPTFAKDPEFVAMFLDEARLAARIRHPNVVPTLDIVPTAGEMFIVMEYVEGAPLSFIARVLRLRLEKCPPAIAVGILVGVLHGLHAAHEARGERGEALGVVHRDVSPQNILVGKDGIARVVDFGIAKAVGRLQTTRQGAVKGKVAYMSPEYLRGMAIDRRADVYAAAVVLWEILAGERLFDGDSDMSISAQVLQQVVDPPGRRASGVPASVDAVVMKGLQRLPEDRYATATEMAAALEQALAPATAREIGAWAESFAGDLIQERAERIAEIESSSAEHSASSLAAVVGALPPKSPRPESLKATARVQHLPRRSRWPWLAAAAAVVAVAGGVALWQWRPGPARALPPAPLPSVATAPPPIPAPKPPETTKVEPTPAVPAPKASARRRPRCNPPYTIDADGIRVPKPECM